MPINTLSNSLSCVEPFSKFDRFCLDFDGTNDKIDAGDITIFDGLSDMSISTWLKVEGSGTEVIMSKGGYNTDGASFNLRYSGGHKLLQYRSRRSEATL